jgi:hypothetical protein
MAEQPGYRRAYRIRTGRQQTLPIPVGVLAQAIQAKTCMPIVNHLGEEMVQAVKDAAQAQDAA